MVNTTNEGHEGVKLTGENGADGPKVCAQNARNSIHRRMCGSS